MEYRIVATKTNIHTSPGFTKSYKRFKSAMNYLDGLIEVASNSFKCIGEEYISIKYYVNDCLSISWTKGKTLWHNRCPKCGNPATERTLRFCCY